MPRMLTLLKCPKVSCTNQRRASIDRLSFESKKSSCSSQTLIPYFPLQKLTPCRSLQSLMKWMCSNNDLSWSRSRQTSRQTQVLTAVSASYDHRAHVYSKMQVCQQTSKAAIGAKSALLLTLMVSLSGRSGTSRESSHLLHGRC